MYTNCLVSKKTVKKFSAVYDQKVNTSCFIHFLCLWSNCVDFLIHVLSYILGNKQLAGYCVKIVFLCSVHTVNSSIVELSTFYPSSPLSCLYLSYGKNPIFFNLFLTVDLTKKAKYMHKEIKNFLANYNSSCSKQLPRANDVHLIPFLEPSTNDDDKFSEYQIDELANFLCANYPRLQDISSQDVSSLLHNTVQFIINYRQEGNLLISCQ